MPALIRGKVGDVKGLIKKRQLLVRLTDDQRRTLERAAKIVSRDRGEVVGLGTILREEGMKGVERILAAHAERQAA